MSEAKPSRNEAIRQRDLAEETLIRVETERLEAMREANFEKERADRLAEALKGAYGTIEYWKRAASEKADGA